MKYSKKLLAVSNPSVVQKKAKQIFGSNVKLQPSKTKTKKYALITPTGKTVISEALIITTIQSIRINNDATII